jgi:hypothetical protein
MPHRGCQLLELISELTTVTDGQMGTVFSALESGLRAARELLS